MVCVVRDAAYSASCDGERVRTVDRDLSVSRNDVGAREGAEVRLDGLVTRMAVHVSSGGCFLYKDLDVTVGVHLSQLG